MSCCTHLFSQPGFICFYCSCCCKQKWYFTWSVSCGHSANVFHIWP